jgi:prefoldin subunit 5
MTSKKQIADIENTIVLLEEKIERLEEEHITMKQMISMQNALIENLQMMVKMISLQGTPQKQHIIHIGGDDNANSQLNKKDHVSVEDAISNNQTIPYLKKRMSRVV